ncbi:MAG: hypothetical protein KKE44_06300 [Proteobacteria bacterium]|nr:hypothetical protein [Pseudomonadota bacterium]MBU1582339.1 hypothetical protein [Pseudomonadota bacterium]MBU2452752.1 hypothetical protein [Pseudomonadota bacterium]MBU2631202.1 hypothetical protein [Pseudomonadota bacterium]
MKFDFKDMYDYDRWLVDYDDAQGYEERYLRYCREFARKTEFPNLIVEEVEMVTGGMFSKERTPAVVVSFKKSTLKGLGIYFRPQRFGNLVHYSLIKTVDRGLWSAFTGKHGEDKIEQMIDKLKNFAQIDEFFSLDGLGNLIFTKALMELDPEFKEMKSLMSKAKDRGRYSK